MDDDFPSDPSDDWDMSPRREAMVMVDLPTTFEPFERERPIPSGRGLLSQAEIEALLRPNLDDLPPPPVAGAEARVLPDFAVAPARDVDADAARRIAARLSLCLRKDCGIAAAITVTGASRSSFDQAFSPGPADRGRAIICFEDAGGEIGAMLSLAGPIIQRMIEAACGGRPGQPLARDLSPLDLALLEGLLRPLAASLPGGLSFQRIETDPMLAAALAPPGDAGLIDLDIRTDTLRAPARLVLTGGITDAAPAPERAAAGGQPVAVMTVMTARVASLMVPLSRLSSLRPGATLLLGVPPDQPVEILSGGVSGPVAAEAQIGRKGNRMALRVTKRCAALG